MPTCFVVENTLQISSRQLPCLVFISLVLSVSRNKEGNDVPELHRVPQYIAKTGSCLESVRSTTR